MSVYVAYKQCMHQSDSSIIHNRYIVEQQQINMLSCITGRNNHD